MLSHVKMPAEGGTQRRRVRRALWGLACACLIGLAPVAGNAQSVKTVENVQSVDKAAPPATVNKVPGKSVQPAQDNLSAGRQNGQQSLDTPGAERRKEIADESAELVALAAALKTEVDKTNQDMLSVGVIRKADEIEKLAHTVKDKLRAGGS